MDKADPAREFFRFQVNRKLINMAKSFLMMLEDVQANGSQISEATFQRLRKRILDECGSAQRELESCIDKLDINLKL